MRHRHSVLVGVGVLALGLSGCGGSDSPATPLTPSPPPQQVAVPAPTTTACGFLCGFTLVGVSLSGVVYELTPTGRTPIAGAYIYCELCGKETHSWAKADESGFYHFSGDLASDGGVWLVAGAPFSIAVGYDNKDYEDPPGLPAMGLGPGWRAVLIDGDTRFDIELVRRATAP